MARRSTLRGVLAGAALTLLVVAAAIVVVTAIGS